LNGEAHALRLNKERVPSGVNRLDLLLGGLFIGDNVIWHDDAGSLAPIFCLNFLQASELMGRPLIYVCFDRSPRSVLEKLGPLADYPALTLLDCFTHGKGKGADPFIKFYDSGNWPCQIVRVKNPGEPQEFEEVLYQTHASLAGDVRFIFESITGMQELWGGEDQFLDFYSHACPRLYDLNTIAYWTLAKQAHSPRFLAAINQIAQVAIELTIKRGTTYLNILKAENRSPEEFDKPHVYWTRDLTIVFEEEKGSPGKLNLGLKLREFRRKRGLSQAELAKQVGVTASTISQIESNLIYPSLPALLKIAEILGVEVASFFQNPPERWRRLVFGPQDAVQLEVKDLPEETITVSLLFPVDFEAKAEPHLIEIAPRKSLSTHFFFHKGEELGYLLSGRLQARIGKTIHTLKAGDLIYLTAEAPNEWRNPGPTVARLFWVKVR